MIRRRTGASLAPDAARKAGKVRGRTSGSLDSVGDVEITSLGGALPRESRVKSIETVEASVANGDLDKRR